MIRTLIFYFYFLFKNQICFVCCVYLCAGCSEIYACAPIKAGEEITISYLVPLEQTTARRQHILSRQFCFACRCSLCQCAEPRVESFLCPQCVTSDTVLLDDAPVAVASVPEAVLTAASHLDQFELRPPHFRCPSCAVASPGVPDATRVKVRRWMVGVFFK